MGNHANLREAFKIKGISLPVNKDEVANRLFQLYEKNKKQLTADAILADAENKKSILHPCFEWNNSKAAHEFRLSQARNIIRHVVVVKQIGKENIQVRAFVNIRRDGDGQLTHESFFSKGSSGSSVYVSMSDAMNDNNLRRYTVDSAFIELERWIRKYENVKQLSAFVVKMKQDVKKIRTKKNLIEQ